MHSIDWIVISLFVGALIWISIVTNRATKSVAGFLSSERKAGRYLLTVAGSMAFCSAIGNIADFESGYQNGLAGYWWFMILGPFLTLIYASGWVIYRYRQTRALTMAEFLERRYSKKFRILAGFTAFISGILNCAVFPMVTANFLLYFLQLPENFEFLGLTFSTFHCLMFVMIGTAVTLATAGGQITIMVTDFMQGSIGSIACLSLIGFVLWKFGWTQIIDTMAASEFVDPEVTPDIIEKVKRAKGASVMNPFKLEGFASFGIMFFIMRLVMETIEIGVWQGGAGYLTSARNPHEARMGGALYGWRWLVISMGTLAITMGVYTLLWHPEYTVDRGAVKNIIDGIEQPYLQAQMAVPVSLSQMLPPGLLGLFAIYMIGASVSTDNSSYHSWGSIFLQDIVMSFRSKPFEAKEHLRYLRFSIIGIGAFAFIFSSFVTLKDYIHMWFAITGAIYVGGASCAIIGGLYWKHGTTQGAFAGLLTGSTLSVTGVIIKQIKGDELKMFGHEINGLHIGICCAFIAFTMYFIVSLITKKQAFNLDKLLHRGSYAIKEDVVENADKKQKRSWFTEFLHVNQEFTRWDKFIYYSSYAWIFFWIGVFIIGTSWNSINEISTESWKKWWGFHLGIQAFTAVIIGIWFFLGGLRDLRRLFKDLKNNDEDQSDDGFVR